MNIDELKKPLPSNAVSTREQSGRKLSYIEGYYAIDTANEIFGFGQWETVIRDLRAVSETQQEVKGKKRYDVHYVCIGAVRVIVSGEMDCRYDDVGYGNGMSYSGPGEAHELAVKEAVTDCMKRCLRHFGSRFGNSLYNKDYKEPDGTDEYIAKMKDYLDENLDGNAIVSFEKLKSYLSSIAKRKRKKVTDGNMEEVAKWLLNHSDIETLYMETR